MGKTSGENIPVRVRGWGLGPPTGMWKPWWLATNYDTRYVHWFHQHGTLKVHQVSTLIESIIFHNKLDYLMSFLSWCTFNVMDCRWKAWKNAPRLGQTSMIFWGHHGPFLINQWENNRSSSANPELEETTAGCFMGWPWFTLNFDVSSIC